MYIYLRSTMLAGNYIHHAFMFWVLYTINTNNTSLLRSYVFYSIKLPFSVYSLWRKTRASKQVK
uniref:Uncharacterized protein n=1 Tax=Arundo donax TaxID=35708 RepID=A0A0A9HEJ9_ARUDO